MKKLIIGSFALLALMVWSCSEDTAFEDNPNFIEDATGDNPQTNKIPGNGGNGNGGGNGGGDTTGNGGGGGDTTGTGGGDTTGNGGGGGGTTFLVDTNPQKRVAVLEDFTGIKCQFCPSGTQIAEGIKTNLQDDFIIIATHGGSFAGPAFSVNVDTGGPAPVAWPLADFRSGFQDPIISQAGVTGYPAGSMNRLNVNTELSNLPGNLMPPYAMSRTNWTNAANQVINMDAPVNVAATATVDANRLLEVKVELYYTQTETDPNSIYVGLLQDGIISPQIGFNGNPVFIIQYEHNDVLRHYLTGQWGDPISEARTAGTMVTKDYVYTIPAEYNPANSPNGAGIAKLEDMKVVVYVARDRVNILNATLVDIQE